jgi:hypothetical protein
MLCGVQLCACSDGGNGVLKMWVFWLRAKEIEEPGTVRNNCSVAGRVTRLWWQNAQQTVSRRRQRSDICLTHTNCYTRIICYLTSVYNLMMSCTVDFIAFESWKSSSFDAVYLKFQMNRPYMVKIYRLFERYLYNFESCINLSSGHIQCPDLSRRSETHRVLSGIVTVQCDFHW